MKIALLAMSGIRVENKELRELGMTLPGLIARQKVVATLPSLSLLTLAGMSPRDVDLEYFEVPHLSDRPQLTKEYDAVAISSYTAQIKEAYALADEYRQESIKVILGGLHVTALPQEALRHADCVILGEGELSWPVFINDLRRKDLQRIYHGRGRSFDLSHAPLPRFELLDPPKYSRLTVQTQRGCPFDCEFCASSIRLSPRFKTKPIDKVVNEIRYIKRFWDRPFVELADDNTFASKSHGKRLARALEKEHIRWFTETDVSVAQDAELLGLLRDSGCTQLLIGFEAVSAKRLEGLERKTNWKAHQLDKYKAAIRKIQSHGITVIGCFILGLDGDAPNTASQIARFVRESGLFGVQVTVQTPFPGTPLYHRLKKSGRLLEEGAWELCTLFDVNYRPSGMSVQELELSLQALMRELYDERSVRERRNAFRAQMRGGT